MPMLSKAQNAAMHASAEGRGNIGIPQSVAKKFVADSQGQNIKKLPSRKGTPGAARDDKTTHYAAFGALDG